MITKVTRGTLSKCIFENDETTLIVPDGVRKINCDIFERNARERLTELVLPDSLESIYSRAFKDCIHLRKIRGDLSKVRIDEGAFDLCEELADEEGFIIVNGQLFDSPIMHKKKTIIVPDKVRCFNLSYDTNRDWGTRDRDYEIMRKIVIPPSVERYGFFHTPNLQEIEIQTTFPPMMWAFDGCDNLKKIILPKGMKLNDDAFHYESHRKKVKICYADEIQKKPSDLTDYLNLGLSEKTILERALSKKNPPAVVTRPNHKVSMTIDGIDMCVEYKVSASLKRIFKKYFGEGNYCCAYPTEIAVDNILSSDEVYAKYEAEDPNHSSDWEYYVEPELSTEDMEDLSDDECMYRFAYFVNVCNLADNDAVLSLVLKEAQKKKNKSLYKGRVLPIAALQFVESEMSYYVLAAKAKEDNLLQVDIIKMAFSEDNFEKATQNKILEFLRSLKDGDASDVPDTHENLTNVSELLKSNQPDISDFIKTCREELLMPDHQPDISKYRGYITQDPNIQLNGDRYVFSGMSYDKWDNKERFEAAGMIPRKELSSDADYLVLNDTNKLSQTVEKKILQALELISNGADIKIIVLFDLNRFLSRLKVVSGILVDTTQPTIIIPNGVIEIDDEAFRGCKDLQEIVIPDSVTRIGASAFLACENLKKINIPNSVTDIGYSAFQECSSLIEVTIPEGVTEISYSLFSKCENLHTVRIPDSVTEIGGYAFSECYKLQNVVLPDSVKIIRTGAFEECESIEQIVIPNSITKICDCAFYDCTNLRNLKLPESPIAIHSSAFWGCSLEDFALPRHVTIIGSDVPTWCENLRKVVIPIGVTKIENNCFKDCELLEYVEIPNTVVEIGYSAFRNCVKLRSITIPGSVKYIDCFAFQNCTNLREVILLEGVIEIGGHAFKNCESLINIVVPNSVSVVSSSAFDGCQNLQFSDRLRSLVESGNTISMFDVEDCRRQEKIEIPYGVTEIENFGYLENLREVVIPDSVISIDSMAFSYCKNLQTITIPDSVISIGSNAFSECNSLRKITIPGSVKVMGDHMFSCCSALQEVTINEGVTYIPKHMFLSCNKLQNVTIPESVKLIDAPCFPFGVELQKCKVSNDAVAVGYSVPMCLKNLKKFIFAGNTIEICCENLKECNSLEEIIIPDNVAWIEGGAFDSVPKNVRIHTHRDSYADRYLKLHHPEFTIVYDYDSYAIQPFTQPSASKTAETKSSNNSDEIVPKSDIRLDVVENSQVTTACTPPESDAEDYSDVERTALDDISATDSTFAEVDGSENENTCVSLEESLPEMLESEADDDALETTACCEDDIASQEDSISSDKETEVPTSEFIEACREELCNPGHKPDREKYWSYFAWSVDVIIGGKSYVFAGMKYDSWKNKSEFEVHGGIYQQDISDDTDYLAVKDSYKISLATEKKILHALELKKDGVNIKIVDLDKINAMFETLIVKDGVLTGVNIGFHNHILRVPSWVHTIAPEENCWGVESLIIPESVKHIDNDKMHWFNDLKSIKLPEWITTISEGMAGSRYKLERIYLPRALKKIDNRAFYGYVNLQVIDLPEGLTEIGDSAFSNCKSLRIINLPDSVTRINNSVFRGCEGLQKIDIPTSVIEIGDHAFYGCKKLKEILIPDSVTRIAANAFDECDSLENFHFPTNIGITCSRGKGLGKEFHEILVQNDSGAIDDYAFDGCKFLECVVISDGIKKIGTYAFRGCCNLKEITIPESVTEIKGSAFDGCDSLKSISIPPNAKLICSDRAGLREDFREIVIPSDKTSINIAAFSGCEFLEKVIIPDGIKSIEMHSFAGCSNLCEITIPESVEEIALYAFEDCESLEKVVFHDGIKKIEGCAFRGCCNLKEITIPESVEEIGGSAFEDCESLEKVVLRDGIKKIEEGVFRGCCNLKEITIPESVEEIGGSAFEDCESLEKVVLRDGIKKIEAGAFRGCCNLKEITIPESVEEIGGSAFEDYESLEKVVLRDGIKKIEAGAFRGCCNLKEITIPESVTEIWGSAFDGCDSLKSISIPPNAKLVCSDKAGLRADFREIVITSDDTTISSFAFEECEFFEKVIISDGITNIDSYSFRKCKNLCEITIPESVEEIGGSAFEDCESLEKVVFYDGIKKIGNYAFLDCKKLQSVCIPKGVTEIGQGAFSGCESIDTIIIPDGVKKICDSTFFECKNLRDITIPSSVEEIHWRAFDFISDNARIHTSRNSYADRFFREWYPHFTMLYDCYSYNPQPDDVKFRSATSVYAQKTEAKQKKTEANFTKNGARNSTINNSVYGSEVMGLLRQKQELEATIKSNKWALFGKKAQERKAAEKRLEEIDKKLDKYLKVSDK